MKICKAQAILFIYEEIIVKGKLVKNTEIARLFEIDNKTVTRYINEINAYFLNFYKVQQIRYSKRFKGYYLQEKIDAKESLKSSNDIETASAV